MTVNEAGWPEGMVTNRLRAPLLTQLPLLTCTNYTDLTDITSGEDERDPYSGFVASVFRETTHWVVFPRTF